MTLSEQLKMMEGYFSELDTLVGDILSALRSPRNREALRRGRCEAVEELFHWVDRWAQKRMELRAEYEVFLPPGK